jgi:DNA (cytosine-5)-methyltransferase 1
MMPRPLSGFRVSSLFAGVGGLDVGFGALGAETQLFCEIDVNCQTVLSQRFPESKIHSDVTTLRTIPKSDLLTAGFPCQDISLAGTKLGLSGRRSGLVNEVFRIVEKAKPEYFLVENVLNLLRIHRGAAITSILDDIEKLGYNWAYRVVDTRGFGLPQRRQRVIILASRGASNPNDLLFSKSADSLLADKIPEEILDDDHGFYWTEGKRGIGWAINAVPTIKGGSGLGIPSPPAIFSHLNSLAGTPSIMDAERLQGFDPGWTDLGFKEGVRWKMVGNAVSTPLSHWIAAEISKADSLPKLTLDSKKFDASSIPPAAFGNSEGRFEVKSSRFVLTQNHMRLSDFLQSPLKPLSRRALNGYLNRAFAGGRRFPNSFLSSLENQLEFAEDVTEFQLNSKTERQKT